MKGNKTVIIVVAAALIFAAAIVVSFYLSFGGGNDNPITLPEPSTVLESPGPSEQVDDNDPFASIKPSNVKAILRTLSRPANYHREISVITNYSGGSMETRINIWESEGNVKLVLKNDSYVKHVLLRDGELCIWYEGADDLYRQSYTGAVSIDELQMTLTYEGILDIPDEMIIDAKYTALPSQSDARCVYIEVLPGPEGYEDRYWVSLDTGLLVEAKSLENDELCYSMAEISMDPLPANDEQFAGRFEIAVAGDS